MIEESARHVGHADILREQADGATGFDGLPLTREPGMPRRARRHGMVVATPKLPRRVTEGARRGILGPWLDHAIATGVPRNEWPPLPLTRTGTSSWLPWPRRLRQCWRICAA